MVASQFDKQLCVCGSPLHPPITSGMSIFQSHMKQVGNTNSALAKYVKRVIYIRRTFRFFTPSFISKTIFQTLIWNQLKLIFF